MSEHTWVQEHLASYIAGGLEAGEVERLERHIESCTACAQALNESPRHGQHADCPLRRRAARCGP